MNKDIEWRIVAPVERRPKNHKCPVVSCNERGPLEGKDLITIAYGRSINRLRGIKRESVSYWSIDESGSTGRTENNLGKAITYTAVTQIAEIDLEELFEGIPKSTDKKGNKEIHYKELRLNNPAELERLVDRTSKSPLLILNLPVEKTAVDTRTVWPKPKNAAYVFRALWRIVETIEAIDLSDTIVISFDKTDDMNDEFLGVLWTDRIIVRMEESYAAELNQISDLAASVTGNAINYPGELDTALFWKLYSISSNISASIPNAVDKTDTKRTTINKNSKGKKNRR